ncbi:MAG TPA: helix-turn-helix transcriptional regulator [Bacteroidia bacterium]
MKKSRIPVFNIDKFGHEDHAEDFYANIISLHLKHHHFINTPHKHDFYLCMLFTRGKGSHEIDFVKYAVSPGSVFFMSPGQTHGWELSGDIEGYIFFHTKEFFDLHFTSLQIAHYPFFGRIENSRRIQLKKRDQDETEKQFAAILAEHKEEKSMKGHKLRALVNALYIDIARLCKPAVEEAASPAYLTKLREFEELLDEQYGNIKFAAEYAQRLNISERHLNRICKECLDKTTSEVIADRILLEAKRLLVNTAKTISEIALELGYEDNAYFSRLFRKRTGDTPVGFRKKNAP